MLPISIIPFSHIHYLCTSIVQAEASLAKMPTFTFSLSHNLQSHHCFTKYDSENHLGNAMQCCNQDVQHLWSLALWHCSPLSNYCCLSILQCRAHLNPPCVGIGHQCCCCSRYRLAVKNILELLLLHIVVHITVDYLLYCHCPQSLSDISPLLLPEISILLHHMSDRQCVAS